MNKNLLALVGALAIGLSGCGGGASGGTGTVGGGTGGGTDGGGGGSTGDIRGLAMPTQLSVVLAQSESTPSSLRGLSRRGPTSRTVLSSTDFPNGSDFNTDPTEIWTYDDSTGPLDFVNQILCYMGQTAADQMVNKGAYVALINESKCEKGVNQSEGQQGAQNGSSSRNTEYSPWVVQSTRTSNTAPQIVHVWVPPLPDDGGNEVILVEFTITEGVSATNPYGLFTMNFSSVDGSTEEVFWQGTLVSVRDSTGRPQFTLFNTGEGFLGPWSEAASVLLNDTSGTSGAARTRYTWTDSSGPQEEAFNAAFNSSNFLRQLVGTVNPVCTSRTSVTSKVHRYDIYHATDGGGATLGDKVRLNISFPFSYSISGQTYRASAGYHGVWLEDRSASPVGRTIRRSDGVQYVFDSFTSGKLERSAAEDRYLADLESDEMYWSYFDPDFGDVVWLVRVMDQGDGLDLWVTHYVYETFVDGQNVVEYVDVDDFSITWTLPDLDVAHLWSDSMGELIYVVDSLLAPSQRLVSNYVSEYVQTGSSEFGSTTTKLYCYFGCPRGGLTATQAQNGDVYYPYWDSSGNPLGPYEYTFDRDNITLRDDQNGAFVTATGTVLAGTDYSFGISSGPMVLDPIVDPNYPQDVYFQSNLFRWETGPNGWNRQAIIKRASDGRVVRFDAPKRFDYVFNAADERNGNPQNIRSGRLMLLTYHGFGELLGFPWYQDDNGRWYRAVNLKDGTLLTDDDSEYVVKAREVEQTMNSADLSQCSSLTLPTSATLALPTGVSGTVTITVAGRPTVTGAPAVVEGAVQ